MTLLSNARAQVDTQATPTHEDAIAVVVRGPRLKRQVVQTTLDATQGRQIAGAQGDPIKAAENLPGVARAALGSDGLVLWGASPADTRAYLDGVEMPRLLHMGGLRSVINPAFVQSVTLTPAAYGAMYGRGIGGLVLVTTRRLPEQWHAAVDLNLLDGSAWIGGPLSSDRNGRGPKLALAARYGWLDRVLHALNAAVPSATGSGAANDSGPEHESTREAFFAAPRFADYQAKTEWDLDTGTLEVAVLGSHDESTRRSVFDDPIQSSEVHDEATFQRAYLRYKATLDDGATTEVVPWFGREVRRHQAAFDAIPSTLDETVFSWGLRADHRAAIADDATLQLGLDAAAAHSDYERIGSLTTPAREGDLSVFGQAPSDDRSADRWQTLMLDAAPHATLDVNLGALEMAPGLRVDGYLLETSRQTPRVGRTPAIGLSRFVALVQPRIEGTLRVGSGVNLLAALGRYTQPPNGSDASAVFGSPDLEPAAATHLSIGETTELTSSITLGAVTFYKWLENLSVRDATPSPPLAGALRDDGAGRSFGAQFTLWHKPWRGFFGWVSHTVSRSERTTSEGTLRPFDHDQPHVLSLVLGKSIAAWSFGARFRYATGAPRALVGSAFYDVKGNRYQPLLSPTRWVRLPDFMQLDLRTERSFALGTMSNLVAYAELLNATNHTNVEEFAYNATYTRRGEIRGLPLLLLFGARLEL